MIRRLITSWQMSRKVFTDEPLTMDEVFYLMCQRDILNARLAPYENDGMVEIYDL